MVDLVSGLQAIVGIALFLAAGYFISFFFFRKGEADYIERIAYSLAFSLTIPPMIIFILNFLLKVPLNIVTVYLVNTILIVSGYFYSIKYGSNKQHKG
jgi:uncharacterized membrane protein